MLDRRNWPGIDGRTVAIAALTVAFFQVLNVACMWSTFVRTNGCR